MNIMLRRKAQRVGLALLAPVLMATGAAVPAAPASAASTTATCAEVIVIAVRGTAEAAGTGYTAMGNVYQSGGLGTLNATAATLKSWSSHQVRANGLIYAAAWDLEQSIEVGEWQLREELNDLSSACPGSRTVLLGYSQGAAVISKSIGYRRNLLTSNAQRNIAAVVFFGDPGYRAGESFNFSGNTSDGPGIRYRAEGELDWVAGRLRSYCFAGDWVCDVPSLGVGVHNDAYDTTDVTVSATQFILGKLATTVAGGGATPITSTSAGVTLQEIAQAGGYTGPVDGVPGTYTWLGAQQVLKGYGYTGPIDGVPGTNTYAALQRLAAKGGYTGPADGVLGPNSWRGLQTILRGFGYTGPIDGAPGPNTYAALQRLAKLGGYTGPIDGALGVNSWRGVQKVLSGYGYTGPIDGVPGVNTYMALQRMAQLGGYEGPIDGVPGPYTWAALARLV